jgi:tyrosine-protein kinase Etk/Wzc
MMDSDNRAGAPVISGQENQLVTLVYRYLARWRWFLASVVLAVAGAYFYVLYQSPLYEVKASILIKDDKKGGALSELSAFEDLGMLKTANNIENEIEILKSRSLMLEVAKELRLNVSYVLDDSPRDKELFGNTPVYFRLSDGDSSIYDSDARFNVRIISNTTFEFIDKKKGDRGTHGFGSEFSTAVGKATLFSTADLEKKGYAGKSITIMVRPLNAVIEDYRSATRIEPVNKTSNVITLTLRERSKEKAAAVVNNLIKQHNVDAIADKNQVSKNTADFINERIKYITAELSDVEEEAEAFKAVNRLVDVESEAKLFLQTGSASELEIVEANTQKALADYMYEYIVTHETPSDLIPANLGLNDQSVSLLIAEYNKLVLDRNRILHNSGEKNPVVENLDLQLAGIRKSVKESLNNYRTALQIRIRELGRKEAEIDAKIASVPKYERQYRIIQRQQQIKETLYLYLLQKREETNIALAVTVANAKIIDSAFSNGQPVWPKKRMVYLVALLIGLALPMTGIYVADLFDTKVHGKRDIVRLGIPYLGDIPLNEEKNKVVLTGNDNSSVAEAFRLLRTNVDFILGTTKPKGRTVFLTSTLSKEGKSFIAMNLAASIAISGKKVLLVGMDVRAPKILQYLGLEETKGLTNYIAGDVRTLDEILLKSTVIENLDVLPSGTIPPNPAELLLSERVAEMFAKVKSLYDYVIVDTAPVGMVTDTLLLSSHADAFIFIVRAYYLDRRLLSIAEDLYTEKRLPNMAILINGTEKKKGYGYGYGYGYGGYGYRNEPKAPFWKRLKKA